MYYITRRSSKRIAVLGAGLQGTCLALELAGRGLQVDLYERNGCCLAEASLHNEGKIHLGYVYAHDETFETARRMIVGGLSFEPLLRRWLGNALDRVPVSSPFEYVVHRDSLVTPEAFEQHARKVATTIAERRRSGPLQYFGRNPARPPGRLEQAEIDGRYDPASVFTVYATEEISADPEALAQILRERLQVDPAIQCLTGRTVIAAGPNSSQLLVTSVSGGIQETEHYDYVVNTLWTGRLPIDAGAGVPAGRPWLFRFKYFVRAKLPSFELASATIVLGPFGDIVNYGEGAVYLSWYPSGMTCMSTATEPPSLPSTLNGGQAAALRDEILAGLSTVIPSVGQLACEAARVSGGWIFARGRTDIGDPDSQLHQRSFIGVHQQGQYLTIDTGKLTMAPHFAMVAADRITGR